MNNNVTTDLRSLRKRAGLSMDKLAKMLGYKGQSSYQRYEDSQLYTENFLPNKIIEGLLEHLVGQGNPPIQRGEILALSGAKMLLPQDVQTIGNYGLSDPGSKQKSSKDPVDLTDIKRLYKGRNDIGIFIVSGNELNLRGVFPGDIAITSDKILPEKGALVVVNIYDDQKISARTEFRVFEPPNVVAVSSDQSIRSALVVDGEHVMVRGTVIRIVRNYLSEN